MAPQDLALLLTALGAGVILPKLFEALIKGITGSASRTRSEIDRIERKRRAESQRADDEAAYRRIIAEHASETHRIAVANGVPASLLPTFPPRPQPSKESARE